MENINDFFYSQKRGNKKFTPIQLVEGERRDVAILFADIKGFTKISSEIDSEELKFIIDKLMQQFSYSIKYYGGYIDKYEGDMVMALFGAKVASEQDTERAILSALMMLDQLKSFNDWIFEHPKYQYAKFDIRIGIDTGLVTTGRIGEKREGDFTVYGNAVNIAARLQQNAPPGRIMLRQEVMERVEHIFEFQPYNTISFKNVDKPIETFLVKSIRKTPLKRWQVHKSYFVGRNKELDFLIEKYKNVSTKISAYRIKKQAFISYPTVIGVQGEAGIGKSRLVYEFINELPEAVVLRSDTPRTVRSPFSFFKSILRNYMGIFPDDKDEVIKNKINLTYRNIGFKLDDKEEVKQLINSIPLVSLLLGVRTDGSIRIHGNELLPHLKIAIKLFFEAVAQTIQVNSPLVVILDDVHLMDKASYSTLEFLVQTLNLERIRKRKQSLSYLFICLYRNDFSISDILRKDAEFFNIVLSPLNENHANRLFKFLAYSRKIDEEIQTEIIKKSGGNPFYLEEWAHLLLEDDTIKSIKDLPIPQNLNSLILSRIDKLEHNAKLMLQKASVIGKIFKVELLQVIEQKLTGIQNVNIFPLLKVLEKNGFIVKQNYSNNIYVFRNEITREVAYNNLLKINRVLLHKIIAETIETKYKNNLSEYYYDLSYHYLKTDEEEKIIYYLEKAGNYAKSIFDNENAIKYFQELVSFLEKKQQKTLEIGILIKLGKTYQLIGKWEESEKVFEKAYFIAEKTNHKELVADSAGAFGSQLLIKGFINEAYKYIQKQVSISKKLLDKSILDFERFHIGDENEINKCKIRLSDAYNNLGGYYLFNGNHEEAKQYFIRSLKLSESVSDQKAIAKALVNIGMIYENENRLVPALENYEKALLIFRTLNYHLGMENTYIKIGNVYEKQNDSSLAITFYKKALAMSEEIGDQEGKANALLCIGNILDIQSEYSEALKYYKESLDIYTRMNYKLGIAHAIENIGAVYEKKKNPISASQYYRQLNVLETISDDNTGISLTYEKLGDIYMEKGNFERAVKYYKKSLALLDEYEHKFDMAHSILGVNKQGFDGIYNYYSKSLKSKEKKQDKLFIAKEIRSIGEKYLLNGDFEKALKHYDNSLSAFNKIRDKQEIVSTLLAKSQVLYYLGHYNKAEETLKRIIRIAKRNDFRLILMKAFELLSKVYFVLDMYDKAIKNIDDAIEIHIDFAHKKELANAMYIKANYLYHSNNAERAFTVCKASIQIALDITDYTLILLGKLIVSKIELSLYTSINTEDIVLANLEAILEEDNFGDIEHLAFYELWQIYKLLQIEKLEEDYRKKALKAFKNRFNKTPIALYKKVIEVLENNNQSAIFCSE